jgi:hypothetical protein
MFAPVLALFLALALVHTRLHNSLFNCYLRPTPNLHSSLPPLPSTPPLFYPLITGNWSESLPYIQSSIDLDPKFRYAYGYRGLLMHGLGWPRQALKDLELAKDAVNQVDAVVGSLSGVCYSCLGECVGVGDG